ncbi:hypothetical protein JW948_10235 [bacterium]|nr:hypothetical protein [bacterium]
MGSGIDQPVRAWFRQHRWLFLILFIMLTVMGMIASIQSYYMETVKDPVFR